MSKKFSDIILLCLLIGLLSAGFLIRIHNLDYTSLSHDEVGMMEWTKGFFERGYPSRMFGSTVKPITTYELVPFSISVPVILFGFNDFAARLHSVFWGTLEILLIYLLGKTLMNRLVGLMAAAICAFHPWCIIWSQNLFYPQLTQSFTTLTVLFFYKVIDNNLLGKKYFYLTGIVFSLMYLSWEGSAIVMFSMLLAILAHKGFDFSWLKNKHLWLSLSMIFLTVLIQQSIRILYQEPYLMVGSSIANISLPTLFFLNPMYDPYYYLNYFLYIDNNVILTIFLYAGIPFIFKNKSLRYLYIILGGTLFFMTNFLQVTANRYAFYLQPFLIVSACGACYQYIDGLRKKIGQEFPTLTMTSYISLIGVFLILFMASNNIFYRFYLLSKNPITPSTLTRKNVYWNDYRSVNLFLKDHVNKGDLIYVMMPHTLSYYSGLKGDFSVTTLLGRINIFDTSGDYPGLLDKYIGNPVTLSLDEFKNTASGYKRVWFLSAPDTILARVNDAPTVEYIKTNFKVLYESYNAKVYLWEK